MARPGPGLPSPNPPASPGRTLRMVAWLVPSMLGWLALAFLSRAETAWTLAWTQRLYGPVVGLTLLGFAATGLAIAHPHRPAFLRLTLLLASLVAVGLGLELLAYTGRLDGRLVFLRATTGDRINAPYASGFISDSDLGFRRPPHARWSGPAATDLEHAWAVPPSDPPFLTFTFDAWGYRNPGPIDHAEVALLGDSFVEGWFVDDDETVAALLQTRLQRPVANLGVAGYGTLQEARVLEREKARLRPSVVVWFFFEGNDLYNDDAFEKTLQYQAAQSVQPPPAITHAAPAPTGSPGSRAHHALTPNALRALRQWTHPLVPNRMPHLGYLRDAGGRRLPIAFADYGAVPWSDWISNRWTVTRTTLQQTARLCQTSGIRLLVCYIPIKFRVYRDFVEFPPDSPCRDWPTWPLPELFKSFCRTSGIPFLDLTGSLRQAVGAGGMPYAPLDSHWSPEGHARVARLLDETLEQRGWRPTQPRP